MFGIRPQEEIDAWVKAGKPCLCTKTEGREACAYHALQRDLPADHPLRLVLTPEKPPETGRVN